MDTYAADPQATQNRTEPAMGTAAPPPKDETREAVDTDEE